MPAEVRVGLLSPSLETRETLRAQVQALGLASVEVEAEQYSVGFGDRATRRLIEVRPDVVIVDMEEADAALHTLRILHTSLPEAWFFVTSGDNDSLLIIEAMRSGAREFLLKPISPRALAQAFNRFVSARQRHERQQDVGKLYCVTATKGGAGATSVAVNLGAGVTAVPRARAAVVDLHAPMGDAAGYLNLSPRYTLTDALGAASRLDGVLLESFMSRTGGLAVLAGPREPWGETSASPAALGRVLEVLMETNSCVFADVPASLDRELLRPMVETASGVLLVITSELPALWRAQRLLAVLDGFGCRDRVRLVLNRARRSDEVSDREIEKTLGQEIFFRLPNNFNVAVQAINSGRPVAGSGGSDLAASYEELTTRLTGLSAGEKKKGFFGLLSFAARPQNA